MSGEIIFPDMLFLIYYEQVVEKFEFFQQPADGEMPLQTALPHQYGAL
jgi:hypothetical protein